MHIINKHIELYAAICLKFGTQVLLHVSHLSIKFCWNQPKLQRIMIDHHTKKLMVDFRIPLLHRV